MKFKGPASGSYGSAVALVLFALTPYLALSTALLPLTPVLQKSVGLSQQGLQLTDGMANAAYAFGTVAAVQLALHLRPRRLLVLYAAIFTVASVLAAGAWTPGLFVAGRVGQGMFTSLMLIAAVPPLVVGWPESKMPWTAAIMDMCIFGAVALGPIVGGIEAGAGQYHAMFWIIAGLGALALLFAILTFEDQPPLDRDAPWDWVAQTLAGGGCAAAFFGASQLETHPMLSTIVLIPLLAGIAMILALVAYQYAIREPLMPLRKITSTIPFTGVLVAMCAGASSVAIVELVQTAMASRTTPTHLGTLFWPEFGAALVTAALFRMLFRTRFVPLLPFAGLLAIAGGGALLTRLVGGPEALVPIAAGLVGLGMGASVSPALFLTGFSLQSDQLPRVFAVVELLRGVAAFMTAPILLHLAETVGPQPTAGIPTALWVCAGLAAGGALVAVYLFVLGRVKPARPQLKRWLDGEGPALESPPLGAGIREDRPLAWPLAR